MPLANKIVCRINTVSHFCSYYAMIIHECQSYINWVLGHGHEHSVLKRTTYTDCLLRVLPLLEQCGEGMLVKHFTRFGVGECNLTIASKKKGIHIDTTPCPALNASHLREGNFLRGITACKNIVKAQRGVCKPLIKIHLSKGANWQQKCCKEEFYLHS